MTNNAAAVSLGPVYLHFNLPKIANTRLDVDWDVGAFGNRYGYAGKYDYGKYGMFLFGATGAIGETVGIETDAGPIRVRFEDGIGGGLYLTVLSLFGFGLGDVAIGRDRKYLRAIAAQRLAEDVTQHGHVTGGFVGNGLICPTLSLIGRPDLAWDLVLTNTYPSWLFSVSFLSCFAVILRAGDFPVFEEGGVELCGFVCLAVEPEAGADLVHGGSLSIDFQGWTGPRRAMGVFSTRRAARLPERGH